MDNSQLSVNPSTAIPKRKAGKASYSKRYYWKNRELCLARVKEHRIKHPEKIKAYNKGYSASHKKTIVAWRKRNPDKIRAYAYKANIKKKYGLTIPQRDELFDRNNGLCEICSLVPSECIDHNHSTGKVRGALCPNCNFLLGHCKDSVTILALAFEYLLEERQ